MKKNNISKVWLKLSKNNKNLNKYLNKWQKVLR